MVFIVGIYFQGYAQVWKSGIYIKGPKLVIVNFHAKIIPGITHRQYVMRKWLATKTKPFHSCCYFSTSQWCVYIVLVI